MIKEYKSTVVIHEKGSDYEEWQYESHYPCVVLNWVSLMRGNLVNNFIDDYQLAVF